MQAETVHLPVLLDEVVEALETTDSSSVLFDGTLGGGGHSEALLSKCHGLCLIATDRDEAALERAARRLGKFGERCHLVHALYSEISEAWNGAPAKVRRASGRETNEEPIFQRMLLDLGISSDQMDDPARGFSFRSDGPLDMRMDRSSGRSAADIVNSASERDLKIIFLKGGVDRGFALRLSREIPRRRPFQTTQQLADLCSALNQPRKGEPRTKNPATLPFQALRIEVNGEFSVLEEFLARAPGALAPGGRLAVISFHSLEDRLVTRAMRQWSRPGLAGEAPLGKLLTRHAVTPQEAELQMNPRARSARMRVFERNL